MKYEKPLIDPIGPADVVIQGGAKGTSNTTDMSFQHTIGAYEADE